MTPERKAELKAMGITDFSKSITDDERAELVNQYQDPDSKAKNHLQELMLAKRRAEIETDRKNWRFRENIRVNGFPRQYDPLFINDRERLAERKFRGIK